MPDAIPVGQLPAAAAKRRPLTEFQAAVVDSILSGEPGSERERIRLSGIAPRTYQVARKRALDSRWLAERFVPDPTLFGRARLSFVLARPKPDEVVNTISRWARTDGAVLIWKTNTTLFGVFSSGEEGRDTAITREVSAPGRYARVFLLELNINSPTLPIYFDFEGEWSRVAGIPGTSFYPRPLPRHPRGTARSRASITPRWKDVVRGLSRINTGAEEEAESRGGFVSRLGERASIARALRSGWIDRRAFLNPAAIPPYQDWSVSQVVFIHGRLREGRRPETLLHTLFAACSVHPFLFAVSGGALLMASLSPAPPEQARSRRGVSIAGTINRFLEKVEVDRLPASELETVVDHRTDLFAEG